MNSKRWEVGSMSKGPMHGPQPRGVRKLNMRSLVRVVKLLFS